MFTPASARRRSSGQAHRARAEVSVVITGRPKAIPVAGSTDLARSASAATRCTTPRAPAPNAAIASI